MKTILLDDKTLTLVKQILRKHFGEDGPDVYVFGSRATGKNIKKYSDIDLAIKFNGNNDTTSAALLEAKFSESSILYRVDVVNYNSVSDEFRAIIDCDKIKLCYMA